MRHKLAKSTSPSGEKKGRVEWVDGQKQIYTTMNLRMTAVVMLSVGSMPLSMQSKRDSRGEMEYFR